MFSTADLLLHWTRYASTEEIVLDDPVILKELSRSRETRRTVRHHLQNVRAVLEKLPGRLAARYRPWCLDEDFYRFGSEAFYQSRILYWLRNAMRYQTDLVQIERIFVARQIIRPSALNSTPRIKAAGEVSYIIYPQAGTAWLYELMGALNEEIHGRHPIAEKLGEYLLYLLAYRAYEASATPLSGYAIDHLIDEIVQRGKAPLPGHAVCVDSLALVRNVEDFIVNHEIAHAFLKHAPGCIAASVMEPEADKLALELMLIETMLDENLSHGAESQVPNRPLVGYLCLNLWGLFRETTEWRAAAFLADTPDLMEQIRTRVRHLTQVRLDRIAATAHLSRAVVSSEIKVIIEAGYRLNARLQSLALERDRAEDVVRLSRRLAQCDYAALRAEISREIVAHRVKP